MIEAVNLKTIDEIIKQVTEIPIQEDIKSIAQNNKIEKIDEINIETQSKEEDHEQKNVAKDEAKSKYKNLIDTIYEKSYELGECFEKSFTFSSYFNNILKINSTAQGECKSKLYKNFSHIKLFIAEVYGEDTLLEFEKIQKKDDKEVTSRIQPSSCVESMRAVKNPNLSQQDLNLDDVLNSKMTNTAMKLFQSPNAPRIKSKL